MGGSKRHREWRQACRCPSHQQRNRGWDLMEIVTEWCARQVVHTPYGWHQQAPAPGNEGLLASPPLDDSEICANWREPTTRANQRPSKIQRRAEGRSDSGSVS